jgi:ubiquinone/menaquinone biosynthesis C-methylase UbiE
MASNAEELRQRYQEFAKSLDYRTTASDYQLRELEIDTAASYIRDGMTTLDVGCGLGYAVTRYASRFSIAAHGIDYSANMVEGARRLLEKNHPQLAPLVEFKLGSVSELPYSEGSFDVVTSHRCLMALLDWELQKAALLEIHRVLKPGGMLVLMEGTFEGLERLNRVRETFGLEPIAPDGRERLITLKFHESQLLDFCESHYRLERIQRFGMYYFLTRVVQPLLVAPDKPSYDHKLNEVARQIARVIPDYDGIGHLVAFVLSRRARGHA